MNKKGFKCWICLKAKRINQWSIGKETRIPANYFPETHTANYAILPQPICKKCVAGLVEWIKEKRDNRKG